MKLHVASCDSPVFFKFQTRNMFPKVEIIVVVLIYLFTVKSEDIEKSCMKLLVRQRDGMLTCEDCEKCSSGYQPYPPCHDGKIHKWFEMKHCRKCSQNHFKKGFNSAPCEPCSGVFCLPNHKIVKNCTIYHPVECSMDCKDGYHKNHFGLCVPCCACGNTEEEAREGSCKIDGECEVIRRRCKHVSSSISTPAKTTGIRLRTTTSKHVPTTPSSNTPIFPVKSAKAFSPYTRTTGTVREASRPTVKATRTRFTAVASHPTVKRTKSTARMHSSPLTASKSPPRSVPVSASTKRPRKNNPKTGSPSKGKPSISELGIALIIVSVMLVIFVILFAVKRHLGNGNAYQGLPNKCVNFKRVIVDNNGDGAEDAEIEVVEIPDGIEENGVNNGQPQAWQQDEANFKCYCECQAPTDVSLMEVCEKHPQIYNIADDSINADKCKRLLRDFGVSNIPEFMPGKAGEALLQKLEGTNPGLTLGEFFSGLRKEVLNNVVKKIHDLIHE